MFPQEWNVRQDPELKITGEIGQKKAQYKKLLAAILDAQEKLQRLEDDKQKLEVKILDFQFDFWIFELFFDLTDMTKSFLEYVAIFETN